MDDSTLEGLFDVEGWEDTEDLGWVRVLADGRLRVVSLADGAIALTGAGGPEAGVVTVLRRDLAELAAFLQHLADTGQPPQLR